MENKLSTDKINYGGRMEDINLIREKAELLAIKVNTNQLISIKQAANLLSVKPNTLYVWLRKKGLPVLRTGRHVKFLPSELIQWARNQQEEHQQKQAEKKDKDTRPQRGPKPKHLAITE
jgi:excisionase family DNA binding protein